MKFSFFPCFYFVSFLPRSQIKHNLLSIYENSHYPIEKNTKYESMEHIIPKSFMIDKQNRNEMHNIILIPTKLNNARANFKFVDEIPENVPTTTLNEFGEVTKKRTNTSSVKCKQLQIFSPAEEYRGMIARAILFFVFYYVNESQPIIFDKVIDKETVLKWNQEYPPTPFEYYKNKCIQKLQGNDNIFISYYNQSKSNYVLHKMNK